MASGFEQRADVQCQTAAIYAEAGRRIDSELAKYQAIPANIPFRPSGRLVIRQV